MERKRREKKKNLHYTKCTDKVKSDLFIFYSTFPNVRGFKDSEVIFITSNYLELSKPWSIDDYKL